MVASVKFTKSAYYTAVTQENRFNNKNAIRDYAQSHHNFHFSNVNYTRFKLRYAANGWVERKFCAIPGAIKAGILLPIFHIAKAIIIGCQRNNSLKYIWIHQFYVIRDIQEAIGKIITVFNDRLGSYLVQQSQFQKSCYDCFSIHSRNQNRYLHEASDSSDSEDELPIRQNNNRNRRQEQPTPIYDLPPSPVPFPRKNNPLSDKEGVQGVLPISEKPDIKPSKVKKEDAPLPVKSDLQILQAKFIEVKKLYNRDEQNRELKKLAYECISASELKLALDVARAIYGDRELENNLITLIAEEYFKQSDYTKAVETIRKLFGDNEKQNDMLARVAEAYFNQSDYEKAIETIRKLFGDNEKQNDMLARVAEIYFNQSDYQKAIETIRKLFGATATENAMMVKVFHKYFEMGDLEKALSVIRKVMSDDSVESQGILQIAEAYFNKNEYVKALDTIEKIHSSTFKEQKDVVLLKLLEIFKQSGNINTALKTINSLSAYERQKDCFIDIAIMSFKNNNLEMTQDIFESFFSCALYNYIWIQRRTDQTLYENWLSFHKNLQYGKLRHLTQEKIKAYLSNVPATQYRIEDKNLFIMEIEKLVQDSRQDIINLNSKT